MHRKLIRATIAGTDFDIPIGTFVDGDFICYVNGEVRTEPLVIPPTGVQGPVSSTDNAIALWDGTTGNVIKNSTVLIDETGNITGVNTINGNPIGTGDGDGDVVGPASSLDNAITRYDGVTGKLIQSSLVLLSDTAQITGVTSLNGRDIALWVDGPTVGSTAANRIAIWSGTDSRSIEDSGLHVGDVVRNESAEVTSGHLAEFGDSTGRVLVDSGVIADHVVTNSGTSTDNAVARWNGTTGKAIQNSSVIIDDEGDVTGVTTLNTRDIARWVDGPAAGGSTDNAVARWDSTTGRLIQNSVVVIDDDGDVTGVASINGTAWTGDYVRGPTPAVSVNADLAVFDGTSGRLIANSGLSLFDVVHTFASEVVTGHLPEYADSAGRELVDSGIVSANIVSSPNTSSDNRIARYDGTTGKVIQQSTVAIDDSGNITGVTTINGNVVATGDVIGPGSATDNRVARFNGTTGKLIQQSAVTLDDSGNLTGVGTINGYDLGDFSTTSGDVVGPASAVDNAVARYNSTTGKLIQTSLMVVDDNGHVSGIGNVSMSGTLNSRDPDELVRGPGGATDNRLVRFDGTTGYQVQNSAITVDDSGNMTGVGTINGFAIAAPATGDVVGPASATDNAVVRFNTSTGKLVQNTGITIDDSNNLAGVQALSCVAINLVVPENHRARHAPGGADSLYSGSWAAGNIPSWNGSTFAPVAAPSGGDVVGPASSVTNRLATFNGTTGKLIQDSGLVVGNVVWTSQGEVTSGHLLKYSDSAGRQTVTAGILADHVATSASVGADNRIARYDGASRALQTSAITIDDSGNMTGVGTINGAAPGVGDVVGPSSSVANTIAHFADTTGNVISGNTPVKVYSTGVIEGVTSLNFYNVDTDYVKNQAYHPVPDLGVVCWNGTTGTHIRSCDVTMFNGGIYNVTEINGEPMSNIINSSARSPEHAARLDELERKVDLLLEYISYLKQQRTETNATWTNHA